MAVMMRLVCYDCRRHGDGAVRLCDRHRMFDSLESILIQVMALDVNSPRAVASLQDVARPLLLRLQGPKVVIRRSEHGHVYVDRVPPGTVVEIDDYSGDDEHPDDLIETDKAGNTYTRRTFMPGDRGLV